MDGPRQEIEDALERAVALAGPDLLRAPQRLRAVVADLVGRPDSDHRQELSALVTIAEAMIDADAERNVLEAAAVRGVPADSARWAHLLLRRAGARDPEARRSLTPAWRRRPLMIGAVALGLVATVGWWLTIVSPTPSAEPETTPSTATTTTTTASTTVPETTTTTSTTITTTTAPAAGFLVQFESAREGNFNVSRTWEVTGGRVHGRVTLEPAGGQGLVHHRELLPGDFLDPVFSPEPVQHLEDVASFAIELPTNEPYVITFDAGLSDPGPDEATVQSWIDVWRERSPQLRPTDPAPAASATITTTA